MAIRNTYSRRMKALAGGNTDPYQYEDISDILCRQIRLIMEDAVKVCPHMSSTIEQRIVQECYADGMEIDFSRNIGIVQLRSIFDTSYNSTIQILDAIEISIENCVEAVPQEVPYYYNVFDEFNEKAAYARLGELVDDLNQRFREASFGYQYEANGLVRVDNQLLHAEVVKPALHLTSNPKFSVAQSELLDAFRKYNHNDHPGCFVECNKAIESVLKVIITEKGWDMPKQNNVSALLREVFDKGLVPQDMQNHFSNLKEVLISAVPTLRNQPGRGHGGGTTSANTPDYLAGYVLHMTAANIVYLIKAYQALP